MAKKPETGEVILKQNTPPEIWIGRLSAVLTTMEDMDSDERSACLSFLKSKYSAEWPRSDY